MCSMVDSTSNTWVGFRWESEFRTLFPIQIFIQSVASPYPASFQRFSPLHCIFSRSFWRWIGIFSMSERLVHRSGVVPSPTEQAIFFRCSGSSGTSGQRSPLNSLSQPCFLLSSLSNTQTLQKIKNIKTQQHSKSQKMQRAESSWKGNIIPQSFSLQYQDKGKEGIQIFPLENSRIPCFIFFWSLNRKYSQCLGYLDGYFHIEGGDSPGIILSFQNTHLRFFIISLCYLSSQQLLPLLVGLKPGCGSL